LLPAKCSAAPELAKRDTTAQSVASNPEHVAPAPVQIVDRTSITPSVNGGCVRLRRARSVESSSDAKILYPHNSSRSVGGAYDENATVRTVADFGDHREATAHPDAPGGSVTWNVSLTVMTLAVMTLTVMALAVMARRSRATR
jgi:hypothetical protein